MNYYIGIDLGTSSLKGILVDKKGKIIREAMSAYPVSHPYPNWSEQNPEEWLFACKKVINDLKKDYEKLIKGIAFSGQMHGLVLLDKDDNIIRPCMLWNDGRSEKETVYLNEVVGKKTLADLTGNIAFPGFTLPKLLWVKNNEPKNFQKIAKIMLPKDYLVYKFTGVHASDFSDASGTLLLDVKNKVWSQAMCNICEIKEEWLPTLYESYDVVGKVLMEYNLPNAVVIAGAGDNAAAAIGTNTINNCACNISLGTSGTIFIASDTFVVDKNNALHAFAHANGKWHLMGCILSAASCRSWWLEDILATNDYKKDEIDISNAESGELIFLPYLMGERCPHNDVAIRGAFIGLSATTTRGEMSKAIMEGVAFALRDCFEIARSSGLVIKTSTLCGGGAKSKGWAQIIANVLDIEIKTLLNEEGPALGAAILAMLGTKEYSSLSEITKIIKYNETFKPQEIVAKNYEGKYEVFKKLYPALKNVYG